MARVSLSRRARRGLFAAASATALLIGASSAGAGNITYVYDELGRLTSATYSTGETVDYSYDPAGNRTQLAVAGAGNSPPTANADAISTPVGAPKTFDPRTNDSDPDNDPLTITAKTNGAHGSVVINSGSSLTYTPVAGYSGGDSFTYTVSDGNGGTDTATVTVTVTATNSPPDAVNDNISTPTNTAKTFDPRANDSDPNNDPLTITAKTNGAHGVVVINSGTSLTYTPSSGYSGSDSFTYTISDGNGGTDTATVSVTVTSSNSPPDAVNDSISTSANTPTTFDPRTNDSDPNNDPLTITAKTNGAHGAVVINGGTSLTYTPSAGYSGSDSFTYTISDGNGGTDTATVSVTIAAGGNSDPVANNDAFTVWYANSATFDPRANDTDPDSDPLTITNAWSNGGATVTVAGDGASITYTPNITSGTDTVYYDIEDGQGGWASAEITVTVRNTNSPPTAVLDQVTRQVGQPVTWDPRVNDTDPDGDPLTVTAANTLTQGVGTVTINNGTSITFTPVPGSPQALHVVVYTISDGFGGTAQSYGMIQAQ